MLIENIRLAFSSMAANKLRTFLTMLGIIIGIASVIAIMTVGNSQTAENERQNAMFGVNNISCYMFYNGDWSDTNVDYSKINPEFTKDMLERMVQTYGSEIEGIAVSSDYGMSGKVTMDGKDSDTFYANVYTNGVNPGYFTVNQNSITLLDGRIFNARETTADSYVCIASNYLVNNLFDGDNDKALGSRITFSSSDGSTIYNYTIIGVYSSNDYSGMISEGGTASLKDVSSTLYVPYLNMENIGRASYGNANSESRIQSFDLVCANGTDVISFTNELQSYLQSLLPEDTQYQVSCYNNAEWIEQSNENMRQQTLTITMIGAISLLVGGIGVMNIMTVSITERTKEIGTRKALGAKNREIRSQFITEAVIISIIGGIIGMIGGVVAGWIVCTYVQHLEMVLDPQIILLSFLLTFAVGVFFGFYPANKAAKMDPIEALRYE